MLRYLLITIFIFSFLIGCRGADEKSATEVISPKNSVSVDREQNRTTATTLTTKVPARPAKKQPPREETLPAPLEPDSLQQHLSYDYRKPQGANLTERSFDPSFERLSGNIGLDGAVIDQTHARSGRRSVHFTKAGDAVILKQIPVEEGKWYIISGYMYVDALPADVMRYYVEYMRGAQPVDIPNYPMFAVSKPGKWEEFILPLYIKKDLGIDSIKLVFRDVGEPDIKGGTVGNVWIDDLALYEVPDSASLFGRMPPQRKHGFDGAQVRVDALGNFMVKKGDRFEPFLPIVIYPGGNIRDWGKYRAKGFNTIICNSIDEAKTAVKLGMHWIWSLYDYGIYDGDEKGYARFEREYAALKKSHPDVLEKLLYFYWDNERYQLFDTVRHFSDTIRKIDLNADTQRLRPFMMQLDFTTANPHYHNEAYMLTDLQSCYANPMVFEDNDPKNYQGVEFKGNYDGEFANFAIFDHIPDVTVPKTVFVVNSPFGDKHIANTIFAAFARGGRGFAYWKDGGSQPAVETKPWWNDFNATAAQMQQLLPLLRTPHWTKWDLNASLSDDEDGLVVGKRDFGDYRCMIAASRSNKAEKVAFAAEAMADRTAIVDYFTGKRVAVSEQNRFELSFEPRGYGVYCWELSLE